MKNGIIGIVSLSVCLLLLLAVPGVMGATSHDVYVYAYNTSTLEPVESAEVNVTFSNGTYVTNGTTDSDGVILLEGLASGTYYIRAETDTLEAFFVLVLTDSDTNETVSLPMSVNSTVINTIDWIADYPLTFSLGALAVILGITVMYLSVRRKK